MSKKGLSYHIQTFALQRRINLQHSDSMRNPGRLTIGLIASMVDFDTVYTASVDVSVYRRKAFESARFVPSK